MNTWMIRYWEDGEEHYQVYHQKKRFIDFINRLIRDGLNYEIIK